MTVHRIVLTALVALVVLAPVTAAELASVTVVNAAPTVGDVTLPSLTVNPTAGGNTTVVATIVASDLNGCNDLAYVQAEVLTPAGASHVAAANATYVSCAAGTAATYTRTFTMRFHDAPAALAAGYKLRVTAVDKQGASGNNSAGLLVFAYAELAALSLDRSSFDFGTGLGPGDTSSVLPLSVRNVGNVQMDAQVAGTALAHATESASIPVSSVTYSTASDMSGAAALGSSAATLSSLDLASGASSARSVYWRLALPGGDEQWVPSGTYSGNVTVTAVKG